MRETSFKTLGKNVHMATSALRYLYEVSAADTYISAEFIGPYSIHPACSPHASRSWSASTTAEDAFAKHADLHVTSWEQSDRHARSSGHPGVV